MAVRSTKSKATKAKAKKGTKTVSTARRKASKCNSKASDAWNCFIPKFGGKFEGAFSVDTEDSGGKFEGTHGSFSSTGTIIFNDINGECDGSRITFWRPKANPRFKYTGKFKGNSQIVEGKRTDLTKQPLQDEDWEAIKTTTLVRR